MEFEQELSKHYYNPELWEIEVDDKIYRALQISDGTFEIYVAEWGYEDTGDAENGPKVEKSLGLFTQIAGGQGEWKWVLEELIADELKEKELKETDALVVQLAEEKKLAEGMEQYFKDGLRKEVHCDWLPVAEGNREAFPDSIKFHEAHGDDLSECDAWVCDCGNGTGGHGFYPCNELGEEVEPDENWASCWLSCCAECLTLYNRSGVEVESKRDKDDESDKRKKIK